MKSYIKCVECKAILKHTKFKEGSAACKNCANHPIALRFDDYKRRYGISWETIEELWIKQGRCCANPGCRKLISFDTGQKNARPHVDHDHATGRVRGLLCNTCNIALGMLHEDHAKIHGLATYLEVS
jgi:hypothetical protein